jgi:ADP-heptose:LPS heptosyltransferase
MKYRGISGQGMLIPSDSRGDARLRLVDRCLGIPVAFLLGVRPKRRHLPRFSSLGLLQTAAIGDTVLMSALLPDIRRSFPEAQIFLFCGSSNYSMARLLPGVDEVIKLPISTPFQTIALLRDKRPEVLCDFGPWPRINALCSALSGARFLIGFRTPGEHRHYVYDRTVEHSPNAHEIENQRALVRALGVESRSLPHLSVEVPLPQVVSPKTYLVFHLWPAGYRSYLKEWPEAHWLELAERVVPLGYDIVLTGGPSERERTQEASAKLTARTNLRVVDLSGQTSLEQTIRVLKDAAAVVSVNTGIVHLAAAVEAAVISLNGPTNAARWGPLGPRSISINAEGPDCGYLNLGFEYDRHREDCMAAIKPEVVFETLTNLLRSQSAQGVSRDSPSMEGIRGS